ncbi:MAG TPA: nucleotidyltransferase family protein [Mucilaginibacter sp.]|nr:nucleotidyltransferase family protein [Mucilaginibacter sp.]
MAAQDDEKYEINRCYALILAAGSSSRLGTPKQLLRYKNDNLLQHAINAAMGAGVKDIVVVLGAYAEQVKGHISGENLHVVFNPDWQTGMASSIQAGIKAVQQMQTPPDAAIVSVCDQPFISADIFNALLSEQRRTGKPIAACRYGDTIGVPALFHDSLFESLLKLNGDSGAKAIIRPHPKDVAIVSFPAGSIDIDTMDEYKKLQ